MTLTAPWRGGWQVLNWDVFAGRLAAGAAAGSAGPGPRLIAVDGHSASGKTTLAERLAGCLPMAAVLHSDDLAWHHSVFDWRPLLVDGVLAPLRAGRPVNYRPPAWEERGRPGAIELPAGLELLILEGVGASRSDLSDLIAASVWVETDEPERVRRDDERIAAGEVTREIYDSWMAVENPFISADRPWSRADAVVAGNSAVPHDPLAEVVVRWRAG
ncbi:MAG TPA: hypothetical protein VEQ66_01765 [Propionibacteriaceae bacterium]|nr:hypothetical protein [Propionibacteriaceae bacterium]